MLNFLERKMGTHKSNPRCRQVQETLSAYVEGDLTAPENHRIAAHIDSCLDCRSEEKLMRQAVGLLAAPRELTPHGDLYVRFDAKLAESMAPRWYSRPSLRWAGTLACLVLVVGVGATVVQQRYANRAPVTTIAPDTNHSAIEPNVQGSNLGNGRTVPLEPNNKVEPDNIANGTEIHQEPRMVDQAPSVPNTSYSSNPKRLPNRKQGQGAPSEFMDVRDATGMTAREKIESSRPISEDLSNGIPKNVRSQSGQVEFHREHVPGAPRVTVIATHRDDATPTGNGISKVRTDTGYDSNGDLALIRIQTEPGRSTDTVRPPDDNNR